MSAVANNPYATATEGQAPQWVRSYVRFLKPALFHRSFDWSYFTALNRWTGEAIRTDLSGLALIPTYTLSRRSQLIRSGDESFILFDCLHAATARMLYYHLTIGSAQEEVLEFLKEHVASSLLAIDADVEALALLDEKLSSFYINALPQPEEFYFARALANSRHLPKVPFDEAFSLIDLFKACHEVCHFLVHRGNDIALMYQQTASAQFDQLLDTIYPEEISKEKLDSLAQEGFFYDLSDQSSAQPQLSQMYKDVRMKLLSQRESLIEEMACDMFAIRAVFIWRLNTQQAEQASGWALDELFVALSLISHLIRLIEYCSERASDIKAGRGVFDGLERSRALHIRNVASHISIMSLVSMLTTQPRMLRLTGKRLVFDKVESRLKSVKAFLDAFVDMPMGAALLFATRSLQAKLQDKQIHNLYSGAARSLTLGQKIQHTMPIIEKFVTRDYFSDKR